MRHRVIEIILPRQRPRPAFSKGIPDQPPIDWRRIALRLLLAAATAAIGAVAHLVATWLGY